MKKANNMINTIFTNKILRIILFFLISVSFLVQSQMQILLYAQSISDDRTIKKLIEKGVINRDSDDEDEDEDEDDKESVLSIKGFIETDNVINTYRNQETADANKKNELRHKLIFKLGVDNFYFYMQNNLYILSNAANEDVAKDYSYNERTNVKRNLLITSKNMEASFNELYMHMQTEYFRIRMGNQVHAWGFTDVIRPTAFLNPYDLREFLFKDEDETRMGVPSLSWLFFIGKGSLEFVFIPVHVPQLSPTKDTFWEPNYTGNEKKLYTVQLQEEEGMEFRPANYGYAARMTSSIGDLDYAFNYYHGPDRQPMLLPYKLEQVPNETFIVEVEQKYEIIDSFGFGFTTNLDKFVLQAEVAYTPNKRGVLMPDTEDTENRDSSSMPEFPFDTQESRHVSYAVGFNYFLPLNRLFSGHEGDSVISVEWSQSKFLDTEPDEEVTTTEDDTDTDEEAEEDTRVLTESSLSNILVIQYSDAFWGNSIPISFSVIFEAEEPKYFYKVDGGEESKKFYGNYILWPKIGWNFQNGFTIEFSYVSIQGNNQTAFSYFKDNDYVGFKMKYEY